MSKQFKLKDGTLIPFDNHICKECVWCSRKEATPRCWCLYTIDNKDVIENNKCYYFERTAYYKKKFKDNFNNNELERLAKQGIYPKYPVNTIVYFNNYYHYQAIYVATIAKINVHNDKDGNFDHFSYNLNYSESNGKLVMSEDRLYGSSEEAYSKLIDFTIKKI